MKKMFKFFMCAAVITAGFVGCSSEEVNPGTDPNPGEEPTVVEGKPTSATFSFKLIGAGETTSAVNSDLYENLTVTEFRVLIFNNADGSIEVDTARQIAPNDSLLTIPLVSGQKRIYVYANGGITSAVSPVTVPAYLTTPATGGITALSTLNGAYSLVTGTPLYTDLPNMHTLYPTTAAGKFYYSSTVDSSLITLKPGISAADSKDPALAEGNYINVWLERPVAKVSVTKNATSGPDVGTVSGKIITKDSAGIIDPNNVKYHLSGLNARMFPFKNSAATPEYIPTTALDPNRQNYYVDSLGTTSANVAIPIANRTTDPAVGSGNYYYLPENYPSTRMRGNTSIAAVEAIFLPTRLHYVAVDAGQPGSGVNYNEATQTFIVYPATVDLNAPSDMYLYILAGTNGLAENTLIAGPNAKQLAQKIQYHLDNPGVAPKASLTDAAYANVSDTDLLVNFVKYTAGKAYYRLDIGTQSGTKTDNKVIRNYYYDCNIEGFLKLGANEAWKLTYPNNEIIDGPTNMTVHIILREWTGRKVGIVVDN